MSNHDFEEEVFDHGSADDCPLCQQLRDEEGAIDGIPFDELEKSGLRMPPPDQVSDDEMRYTLWGVIDGLATLRIFMNFTDHLSDRELYTLLWTKLLRERVVFVPAHPFAAVFLRVLGPNDELTWLRYYAPRDLRKQWSKENGQPFPKHVDPPYGRDLLLPNPFSAFEQPS